MKYATDNGGKKDAHHAGAHQNTIGANSYK
jgi:hypothetical protein